MTLHKFLQVGDDTHDSEGWVGMPEQDNFDPASGFTLCHDIFEEFECPKYKQLGLPHNELLAFGAMYFVRGSTGYFDEFGFGRGCAFTMGAGWESIFEHVIGENMHFKIPPKTYALQDKDAEADLQAICEEGRKTIFGNHGVGSDLTGREKEDLIQNLSLVIHWLRIGYRRAEKRYRNCNRYDLSYMFTQIREAVEIAEKDAEPGDQLWIFTDFKNNDFRVEKYNIWDLDDDY